jgi:hypothetical protein
MMSFDAPEPLIEPAVRLLGSVELGLELELVLGLDVVLPLVLPLVLLSLAFFSTNPPPAPALLDGLAVLLDVLAPLSRCRQPVAVICPAMSLDGRAVGWLVCGLGAGWLLCGLGAGWLVGGGVDVGGLLGGLLGGVDGGGVCAASVPHKAMPLHSVAAHCH